MRYDLGAKVVSSDGKDVGKVDQFVLDPRTETIREIVIHKGFLVQHDIIVPTSKVRDDAGDEHTLHLTMTADEVARLPQFEETAFVAPPAGLAGEAGFYPGDMLATGGMLWPAPAYSAGPARETGTQTAGTFTGTRAPDAARADDRVSSPDTGIVADGIEQARPDDVFITSGTDVYMGDEKIGTLDEVIVDERSGKVAQLLVKRGIFGGDDVRLPAQYIERVSGEGIHLAMPAGRIDEYTTRHD